MAEPNDAENQTTNQTANQTTNQTANLTANLTAPAGVRIGAALVRIEAVALLAAAIALLVLSFVHDTTRLWAAFVIVAFALLGAAVLWFGALGLLRLQPAWRSPIVLMQLLAIPVAVGLLQAGRWAFGVPILAVVLVVLYELFRPASRQALDHVI